MHKNNYFEKAVVLVVLFALFMTVFSPLFAYAQGINLSDNPEGYQIMRERFESEGCGDLFSPSTWIPCAMAYIGEGVLNLFGSFMWISGGLLNGVVDIALKEQTYNDQFIKDGWSAARNVANLFFIFVLLIIAIATILGLETYGAKNLLATLIIAALFINFSYLLTTTIIIKPFNQLASGIYKGLEEEVDAPKAQNFTGVEQKKQIAEIFLEELDPHKVFTSLKNPAESESIGASTLGVLIATTGGSIVVLTAAFIMFVAVLLFVWRIIALWLLIIFSPFAFLLYVLPATKKWAMDWFHRLFKQAVFPAVFLFLLWLVVKMIKSGLFERTFEGKEITGIAVLSPVFVLRYIFIIILLTLTITVSQILGGQGAATIIGWSQRGRKWAVGAVRGYAGRATRPFTGRAARAITEGEGRVARAMRAIPGLTRVLSRVPAQARADIDKYKQQYSSRSSRELKNLSVQMGTNRTARIAMNEILASRGDLKPEGRFSAGHIRQTVTMARQLGRDTSAIERLGHQYAETPQQRAEAVPNIRINEVGDLSPEYIAEQASRLAMLESWTPAHMQRAAEERSADEFRQIINELRFQAGARTDAQPISRQEIARLLREQFNNHRMAGWVESGPAASLLAQYNIY